MGVKHALTDISAHTPSSASTDRYPREMVPYHRPPSPMTVREAIHLRDAMGGRQANVWRQELDEEVRANDAERAEFARHRKQCVREAQQWTREKAGRWREKHDRNLAFSELRWRFREAGIGKLPGEPKAAEETEAEGEGLGAPTPLPTPTGNKSNSSRQRRRPSAEEAGRSGSDGSDSQDKPGQALRVRMRRIRKLGQERMRQAIEAQGDSYVPRDMSKSASKRFDDDSGAPADQSSVDAPAPKIQRARTQEPAKKQICNRGKPRSRSQQPRAEESPSKRELKRPTHALHVFEHQTARDIATFKKVFDAYDTNGSASLDQKELKQCLADVGLRGTNEEERAEVKKILWSTDSVEVSFDEFCSEIVPLVRQRLADMKESMLREKFKEADVDMSGLLSIEEMVQITRLMGTVPSKDQVLEAILDVSPDVAQGCKTIEGTWIWNRDVIDFEKFRYMVPLLQERKARENHEHFSSLADDLGLADGEREWWRESLVDLHNAFQRSRAASSPVDVQSESVRLIRDYGLCPPGLSPDTLDTMVASFLDAVNGGKENLDFTGFLKVVGLMQRHDRKRLEAAFDKYDFNRNGSLSILEVQHALAACNLKARDANESDQIRMAIVEFDEDSSGEVDRVEFVKLVQFTKDRMRRRRREEERQLAIRHGYTEENFEDIREAFLALDEDMSEALDAEEVENALKMLRRTSNGSDAEQLLEELGLDPKLPTLRVDLPCFMRLMFGFDLRESLRATALKHGYKDAAAERVRSLWMSLNPSEEGFVRQHMVFSKLQSVSASKHSEVLAQLERDLTAGPPNVGFEVFLKAVRRVEESREPR